MAKKAVPASRVLTKFHKAPRCYSNKTPAPEYRTIKQSPASRLPNATISISTAVWPIEQVDPKAPRTIVCSSLHDFRDKISSGKQHTPKISYRATPTHWK